MTGDSTYLRKAYDLGHYGRNRGYERESNPYHNMLAEQYWFAGFDGVNFDEFDKFVKESRREIKSTLGYSRVGLNNV